MEGALIIITGERGTGKTSLVKALVNRFRQAEWQIRGVLSPAIFEEGQKTGIYIVNLATDEERALAVYHRKPAPVNAAFRPLHWDFLDSALTWGDRILAESVPCDLLIVDELGPLELIRGEGWQAGIQALNSRDYRLAILVMRPSLLENALEQWPWAEVIQINRPDEVGDLVNQISMQFLKKS